MPNDADTYPDEIIIRQGKLEEGENRGEGWVVLRALALVVLVTAALAYFVF
ncbi:hypothetical protein [Sediminicoccus sp. KRV36]|uniref:hypothetical protein n=1 Tax=Sediminicoccus sp. KRV36 TaxID=3133721 RepID=UPI00200BE74F|nr:hypothetical protein [Sediminicoccus rosea]UPY38112.1 hypothetical protein LHU95_05280 [Sediminicoccus rosea]